jgi:chemotaxis protein CheX
MKTMNNEVAPARLVEIAQNVWQMVLGFRLRPVESDPRRPEAQDLMLARVSISGAWQGELTLGCSTEVARRAAAAMFGKLPKDANPEEIRDALGELANMVGGNFKTALKGDCRLSVPTAVNTIPHGQLEPAPVKHQWFECEGGFVFLHVLRKGSGP